MVSSIPLACVYEKLLITQQGKVFLSSPDCIALLVNNSVIQVYKAPQSPVLKGSYFNPDEENLILVKSYATTFVRYEIIKVQVPTSSQVKPEGNASGGSKQQNSSKKRKLSEVEPVALPAVKLRRLNNDQKVTEEKLLNPHLKVITGLVSPTQEYWPAVISSH